MLVLRSRSANMVDSFLKYISYEKRYSQHTVTSYQNDLRQFTDYLSNKFNVTDLAQASQLMVRSWVLSLMDEGIAAKSVNRKIASLRSYYKFMLKREAISKDPTARVKLLKTPKELPDFADEQELSSHLDGKGFEIDGRGFDEGFKGNQQRIIMELLYGTGMRLSELLGVKETDISRHDRTVKVLGKRNKERIIPISASLIQVIDDYINDKNHRFEANPNGKLIVNNNGGEAYPMLIYRTVKEYLNRISSVDKKSPHVLRHTFATHLLNKGADLNAVKDLLGHSSLAATQVYTHNSLDKLKAVFDQAHPKA